MINNFLRMRIIYRRQKMTLTCIAITIAGRPIYTQMNRQQYQHSVVSVTMPFSL